jgi:hypothetical protein
MGAVAASAGVRGDSDHEVGVDGEESMDAPLEIPSHPECIRVASGRRLQAKAEESEFAQDGRDAS